MRGVSRKQTTSRGDGDLYSCESGDELGGALGGMRFGAPFHLH
jgi:hypothetical protein